MHYAHLTITYNGEIFNYVELREQLRTLGYSFRSESDTEVVLAAYLAWGPDCARRFNGMWAFAIWDEQKQELFMCRDRYGEKPLYYTLENGKLAFASEMPALFPYLPRVELSSDFGWCRRHLYSYEGTDKCLVAGVKRFPAAHYAIYSPGDQRLKLTEYWDTLAEIEPRTTSYAEQVEEFRALFQDACRIRMRSDVPIGIALSGGIDSSVVAAAVAEEQRKALGKPFGPIPLTGYVASFPDTKLDETVYARQVVEHLDMQGEYINMTNQADFSTMERYVSMFAELSGTSPIPMIELYRSIRQRDTVVTLDGHGGDELLSGYTDSLYYTFLDDLSNASLNTQRHQIVAQTSGGVATDSRTDSYLAFSKFYAKRLAAKGLHQVNAWPGINYRLKAPYPMSSKIAGLDYFNSHLYELTHDTILPTLLRNFDRFSMIGGVESRIPFLDHRVVTFMFSIPSTSKLQGNFTKSIVRDAYDRNLPNEVIRRTIKLGFGTPVLEWIKTVWREPMLDIAHSKELQECEVVNGRQLAKQIETLVREPKASFGEGVDMWANFQTFLWYRNIIGKPHVTQGTLS